MASFILAPSPLPFQRAHSTSLGRILSYCENKTLRLVAFLVPPWAHVTYYTAYYCGGFYRIRWMKNEGDYFLRTLRRPPTFLPSFHSALGTTPPALLIVSPSAIRNAAFNSAETNDSSRDLYLRSDRSRGRIFEVCFTFLTKSVVTRGSEL